jgi:hypothetical protein
MAGEMADVSEIKNTATDFDVNAHDQPGIRDFGLRPGSPGCQNRSGKRSSSS